MKKAGRLDNYSAKLRLMKRIGAAICLILLAAVALWPGGHTIQSADDIERAAAAKDSRAEPTPDVQQAALQSVDPKNRPYNIYADTVTNYSSQNPEADAENRHIKLANPKGNLALSDGSILKLTATAGLFKKELLFLNGGVSFIHEDSGYAFKTERATIDLKQKAAESNRTVQGHNRLSRIEAEGFRIKDGGREIFFVGNAKLYLYPEGASSDGEPNSDNSSK